MRVIGITGSSGFVGKNLLERLEADTRTWPMVRIPRWSPGLEDAIGVARPDIIIHLAAKCGGIQDNIAHQAEFLADNLDVGMRLLKAAKLYKIPRVLNIGSSCMYPVAAPQPFKEESLGTGPVEPTNEGYATAKLTVMRFGQYLTRSGDVQVKTLIPPGLYGPHAHFEGDKAHLVCAVMARLHKAKREGAKSVPVWGDGTARREFLFAPDLADCIVRAIDEFDSLPEVMNVGRGRDLTVDEWVSGIAEIVGYEGEFTHDPSKPSGQAKKVMDISRAIDWGWVYDDTLLGSLRATYDWYLANAA